MIMETVSLKKLFIYPVKSLQGISLTSSRVTSLGLEYDRRWMIVDEKGRFITQRLYPQLSLIKTTIVDETIILSADGHHKLLLPLCLSSGDSTMVTVWRDSVESIAAPSNYNEWISAYLGIACRFVYMPDSTVRAVDQGFATSTQDSVSFADGFPFLIISQGSLDNLNEHLQAKGEQAVPIQRFRPNLFVDASQAFAEDHWQTFAIGNNQFHNVKPCSRCIMTTVDASGNKGKEPLATLLEYRKQGQQAYFGQNAILDNGYNNSLTLKVGDSIRIIQSRIDK
jgi:uncharacterized protein YcbX